MNFKQVLLGEGQNLIVGENSEWPKLESVGHGHSAWRNSARNDTVRNTEESNDSIAANTMAQTQASTSSTFDFPRLTESVDTQLVKQVRERHLRSKNECDTSKIPDTIEVKSKKDNKYYISKCKKHRTMPDSNLTVDMGVMLKISLSLAEKRRQKKRMKHSGKLSHILQEQLAAKNIICGNKLDSDCPKRYKGKKRPHKRHQVTIIKRGFQWAADRPKLSASIHFTKRMYRLRQKILAGIAEEQDIDGLVTNLGRIGFNDEKTEQTTIEKESLPIDYVTTAKSIIHSNNFRPYCNHLLKTRLKNKARELIKTLRIFQDKMYLRDPINSKAKRRYVCGSHEARKFLKVNSVKLLFIANNIIANDDLPPILAELLKMAEELQVPVLFAGSLKDLGYWTLKKSKTCAIAILNYDGAEKLYKEVIDELIVAKNEYQILLASIQTHFQQNSSSVTLNSNKEALDVKLKIMDDLLSKLT